MGIEVGKEPVEDDEEGEVGCGGFELGGLIVKSE